MKNCHNLSLVLLSLFCCTVGAAQVSGAEDADNARQAYNEGDYRLAYDKAYPLAKNGEPVEYGQPLFKVDTNG